MKDPAAFDFDADYGEEYDWIARTVIPGYEQTFTALAALLASGDGAPGSVLIVGTGTGRELVTLGTAFPDASITAVDPSERMIALSREAGRAAGLDARTRLVRGFTDDLDPDAAYDVATVFNVMHFLADDGAKEALLRSVSSRVRPGGRVVLFDLHGDPSGEPFRLQRDTWYDFFDRRGLTGAARERFVDRLDRGIVYVPESRILELCDRAGLDLVTRWYAFLLYGGWLLRRR